MSSTSRMKVFGVVPLYDNHSASTGPPGDLVALPASASSYATESARHSGSLILRSLGSRYDEDYQVSVDILVLDDVRRLARLLKEYTGSEHRSRHYQAFLEQADHTFDIHVLLLPIGEDFKPEDETAQLPESVHLTYHTGPITVAERRTTYHRIVKNTRQPNRIGSDGRRTWLAHEKFEMYNQNFLCGWACPLQSCVYNVSTTDRSTVYKHQIETHKKSRSTVLPPIPLFPGEIPQLENPSWLPHGCAGLYVNDHPREDDIDCVNCNRPAYLCARWGVPTMARYWGDDCPWREPTDWQWNRERQKLLETSEKYAEDSYYDTYGKYDSAPNGPPLWGSIGSEPLRW